MSNTIVHTQLLHGIWAIYSPLILGHWSGSRGGSFSREAQTLLSQPLPTPLGGSGDIPKPAENYYLSRVSWDSVLKHLCREETSSTSDGSSQCVWTLSLFQMSQHPSSQAGLSLRGIILKVWIPNFRTALCAASRTCTALGSTFPLVQHDVIASDRACGAFMCRRVKCNAFKTVVKPTEDNVVNATWS